MCIRCHFTRRRCVSRDLLLDIASSHAHPLGCGVTWAAFLSDAATRETHSLIFHEAHAPRLESGTCCRRSVRLLAQLRPRLRGAGAREPVAERMPALLTPCEHRRLCVHDRLSFVKSPSCEQVGGSGAQEPFAGRLALE
uniref:Uncharacterized protein n=1 Tax=Myotis myotis TaxID=51298 RepID=A0A7J7TTM0_MYOMY|nr:hypothetical protein mMyoMyo1_008925 [Myotis myotis]